MCALDGCGCGVRVGRGAAEGDGLGLRRVGELDEYGQRTGRLKARVLCRDVYRAGWEREEGETASSSGSLSGKGGAWKGWGSNSYPSYHPT